MASLTVSHPLLLPPSSSSSQSPKRSIVCFQQKPRKPMSALSSSSLPPLNFFAKGGSRAKFRTFLPLGAQGEATETEEVEETEVLNSVNDISQENVESDVAGGTANGTTSADIEEVVSFVVKASLQGYKEALANDDQSALADIESSLVSIEEEKSALAIKVASMTMEVSSLKDKVLRISADFDNFRKRTERDRLSFMSNVQGEILENLLPILDNFERAKSQIKVETEGEEKINNSYQSIYKQFVEVMGSLGVKTVETIGKIFDPSLHEAIMREDSAEYDEGIVMEEFRKGFILGERLLRPAMVKVSAGPGPAKPAESETQTPASSEIEIDGSEPEVEVIAQSADGSAN